MTGRSAKRRKLSDADEESPEAKQGGAYAADSGTTAYEDEFSGIDDEEEPGEDSGDSSGSEGRTQENEKETVTDGHKATKKEDQNGTIHRMAHIPPRKATHSVDTISNGTSQSNLFKLQTEEMLCQVAPKYGKKEALAEVMLRTLKDLIERIPDRSALPVEQAERQLVKSHKIVVPFPKPKPSPDVNYKLSYSKPAGINVAGSYPLKTAIRVNGRLSMDFVVVMPSSIFSTKDYLNHRYFHKRAFYLACIAAGLRSAKDQNLKPSFSLLNGNYLTPIIIVKPADDDDKSDFFRSQCDIRILLAVADDIFPILKTLPGKNCVRPQQAGVSGEEKLLPPTPFYNATIRADLSYIAYLKLLHSTGTSCVGYQQACLLGRVWLRQRGLSPTVQRGGFGNFEWSALVALLLLGGGANDRPLLSSTYDGQQLFRATLQLLATRDLIKKPLKISAEGMDIGHSDRIPMVFDAARGINIFYKTTSWSYQLLRQEAQSTIKTLSQGGRDKFDPTFIVNVGEPLLKYDAIMRIPISELVPESKEQDLEFLLLQKGEVIQHVLNNGLGDRTIFVNVTLPKAADWAITTTKSHERTHGHLVVGFVADPTNMSRAVDRGPAGEGTQEAAAFREFWGQKAELRRFKDGQILESVVWDSKSSYARLVEIATYLLGHHISVRVAQSCAFIVNNLEQDLLGVDGEEARSGFDRIMTAYKAFEKDVRGLKGLPLEIRQIQTTCSDLRSTSVIGPFPRNNSNAPADVVIQFEGSGRWPDDLMAIQMTKIAFLLMLEGLLMQANDNIVTRLGLENEQHDFLNKSFLDIHYPSGAAFRIRIHHEREQVLIERRLAEASANPKAKLDAAAALAHYKSLFVQAPLHTQAMQTMTTRHPAFSSTVRLVKKWFNAHLLGNHFTEELIETIVARTFLQPQPWQSPSSSTQGLLRTLLFLSRWDWQREPLIVDYSESIKPEDVYAIRTRFDAWRKLDPVLNRVVLFVASNLDLDGTTWTDFNPAKVVVGRMASLASAALKAVQTCGLDLDPSVLFKSPLSDYDFVIHLSSRFTSKIKAERKPQFKNLQSLSAQDRNLVGYSPVELFFQELRNTYEDAITFFHDINEGDVIAGLWNPHTVTRPWKVNLSHSTMPQQAGEHVDASINKEAILAEIARLGDDLITRITLNR